MFSLILLAFGFFQPTISVNSIQAANAPVQPAFVQVQSANYSVQGSTTYNLNTVPASANIVVK